jgi:hypothetical protein
VGERLHHHPSYWSITRGVGCVQESPTGFTRVTVDEPGRVRVGVNFAPWRAIDGGRRCADPPAARAETAG